MKKLLLLINPFAGKGNNLENSKKIIEKLPNWEIKTVVSEYKGYFIDYLQSESVEDFDAIGVVGGDGTMHEVINGLIYKIENCPPIMLFPFGSGNSLNFDVECLDLKIAISRLNIGKIQNIDIYKLTTKNCTKSILFFNIVGWGLVGEINILAEKLRWLRDLRYNIASLVYIFINPKYRAKIEIDNQQFEGEFNFVLAANTKHTGKGMKMTPLADLSDGLLDCIVVKHLPFYHLLRLFPLIFTGKHINSNMLEYIKAKKVKITSNSKVLIIDGEIKGETPCTIEIIPQKLKMIV